MMRKPGEQPGRRKLNDIWNAMLAKNATHQKNSMPDGKCQDPNPRQNYSDDTFQ